MPKSKPPIDKDTPYHFIFGLISGIIASFILDLYPIKENNVTAILMRLLIILIGLILIPTLEFIAHKIVVGHASFKSINAIMDLFFAYFGFIIIMLALQISPIILQNIN